MAPDHWAYEELERFEAQGLLHLPGVRPYTRRQVQEWVQQLLEELEKESSLSPVGWARLERLEAEFLTGDPVSDSSTRYDPPLMILDEGDWGFMGDATVSTGSRNSVGGRNRDPDVDDSTTWGLTHLESVLRFSDWATYQTRYVVSWRPQEGRRVDENLLSARERNFRGLTSNNDRSYVAMDNGKFRAVLGREYVGWGMQRGQELLVSDQGFSMDGLALHLQLGRYRLASITALLSSLEDRWYSAHRLEISMGPVLVGVQETVVYKRSNPEPRYFLPISYYYGNQFNEGGDDNVFLSFDAKWNSRAGVLDFEFMVDDFIYDGDPAPQKVGLRLGWRRSLTLRETDLDLQASYVGLTRWTFTHRNLANAFVGGTGDINDGQPFLGSALGPDADRLQLKVGWSPDLRWTFSLLSSRIRRGEGNRDFTAWVPGQPYSLRFPSGEVLHENLLALETRYRFKRRLEVLAAGGYHRSFQGGQGDFRAQVQVDF